MTGPILGSLQEMAQTIEESALIICRVLPSTRECNGFHVQLGHRDSWRRTYEFPNGSETASFLLGIGETCAVLGRVMMTPAAPTE